jgi:hypothetical protein
MSVRTKKPLTETQCTLTVTGPMAAAAAALMALRSLGFVELASPAVTTLDSPGPVASRAVGVVFQRDDASAGQTRPWELPPQYQGMLTEAEGAESVPWREAFPPIPESERPGRMLRAARTKEDLSQTQLATLTGIPQRHISEMEHGKRPIGKERAKKLANALQIDYHVFL